MSTVTTDPATARLALSLSPGQLVLEGAWWPRTHRLDEELPPLDLAIHDATGAGVARFAYIMGSWLDQPRKVRAASHVIKVGWFSSGLLPDSVDLGLDDYRRVVLVVVPPETDEEQAEAMMSRFAGRSTRPTPPGADEAGYRSPDLPAGLAADLAAVKESVRRAIGSIRHTTDGATRTLAATTLEADLALAAAEARTVAVPVDHPASPAG